MDEKEKTLTSPEYVEAARIIATCPKSRLPMVLEILRQSGIEIQPEPEAVVYRTPEDVRKGWLKEKRETEGRVGKGYPDSGTWILLKRAYDEGVSFIELSRRTGIHKTALYHFLHGEKNIQSRTELLESTIREMLGIPEPPKPNIPFWEDGEEELPKKSTRSRK